jgi:UDP-glucose 4-epimerase
MFRVRIAVTGGSGFIGSRLVRRLLEDRYEVVSIDIKENENNHIETRLANVVDLEETKSALKDVDAVFHLAGYVVEPMRTKPYEGTDLHVNGTLNILQACKINRVRKILFASSFYVYDGINEKMIVNEETPLDILKMELFGVTKLLGEALVREYSHKYELNYVIFRFGSAYGAGNCSCVVKTFLDSGLRGETLEIWGEGNRANQYTYVDDIVEGCVLGLNQTNETFNLVSPESTTTGQLAQMLREKYGFEVTYNKLRKEGPSLPYISSEKVRERLGWKIRNLQDGIEDTMIEMRTLEKSDVGETTEDLLTRSSRH